MHHDQYAVVQACSGSPALHGASWVGLESSEGRKCALWSHQCDRYSCNVEYIGKGVFSTKTWAGPLLHCLCLELFYSLHIGYRRRTVTIHFLKEHTWEWRLGHFLHIWKWFNSWFGKDVLVTDNSSSFVTCQSFHVSPYRIFLERVTLS